jgi:hypothetical protein
MSVLKTATHCWRQVTEAEIQAAQITDQHLKAVYLRIAHQGGSDQNCALASAPPLDSRATTAGAILRCAVANSRPWSA